jgi:drug/metabolite transporter (DMT)-like permease
MYTFYLASFRHLAAWQVALWTVFTPILVVLLSGLVRGRVDPRPWLAASLAVAGALLAQGQWPRGDTLTGILLVQASNLCFAAGQLGYRVLDAASATASGPRRGREAGLLGWMYLGGALLTLPGALILARDRSLAAIDLATVGPVLLYLGLVPTAAGFWLWNKGAARTTAARLAVANNLKVPLAVLVAWLVFAESAPYLRAAGGLAVIMVALALATRPQERDPGRGARGP